MAVVLDDPDWGAMSQGEACPDNNIMTPAGLHLVDFEEAVGERPGRRPPMLRGAS